LVCQFASGANDLCIAQWKTIRQKAIIPQRAMRSINKAIGLANKGDTVLLLEGTYKETIRINTEEKAATEKPVTHHRRRITK
jgi:hypothetical protein